MLIDLGESLVGFDDFVGPAVQLTAENLVVKSIGKQVLDEQN